MKQLLAILSLGCIFLSLASCRTPQAPIKHNDLVGSYVYWSEDPDGKKTDHEGDHLQLDQNDKYVLIQDGSTGMRSQTTGTWQFSGGSYPHLTLDHAGYPVEVAHGEIRLMINDDVGIGTRK